MNKKLSILFAALCTATLSIAVYASNTIPKINAEITTDETPQLQSVLDNSKLLNGVYNAHYRDDVINGNVDENEEKISTVGAVNAENAVKLYNVSLTNETTSLKEQLDKDNEQWFVTKNINGKMSYIFIKKGADIETATQKINALNISSERKEKMIAEAEEKAGKWYVSKIFQPNNSTENDGELERNITTNTISANGINDVKDMKYIYINNTATLGIWVQTETGEYIIPYNTSAATGDLSVNQSYTLSDVTANIVK